MVRYAGGKRSDLSIVKEAVKWLRQFRLFGRPDRRYADQIDDLRMEVEDLRKLVAKANTEHDVAAEALNKISRLPIENPALHGAQLGRAVEIAGETHRKIN